MESFSVGDIDPTDERAAELITTFSIFPELVLSSPHSATISLPVTLVNGIYGVFNDQTINDGDENNRRNLEVAGPMSVVRVEGSAAVDASTLLKHLPPVQLTVILSEDYPGDSAPQVELESIWMPEETTQRLKSEIRHIWEDARDQVVYAVIDHLIQSSEDAFQAGSIVMDGHQGQRIVKFPNNLKDQLVTFDKIARRQEFEKWTYPCGVCLEPKKGTICHSLFPCHHVFCKPCLQDFYTSCIEEGNLSSVKCLDTTCVLNKKKNELPLPPPPDQKLPIAPPQPTLPPSELTEIGLSDELVTRYRMLKRKTALDADPNTIYCPRKWCQAPSRASVEEMDRRIGTNGFYVNDSHMNPQNESEVAPETVRPKEESKQPEKFYDKNGYEKDRMDVCSECGLAFCNVCMKGWHGYYQVCRPKDAPLSVEEIATEEYLESHATKCPSCLSWCIKSHGCNHMSCKCGTHFCFLCGAYLEPQHPYFHFNTPGHPCHMRLWEGEEGDGEHVFGDLMDEAEINNAGNGDGIADDDAGGQLLLRR